ncbi:hypothetical protein [Fischerella sp. PCC 9605]|uniref:hypothetical protein n=1 Tax=Fischerella sp. PCC 9605 TaxID=1173024 RepID=UPI0004B918E8|nr:hypothetical protein [Fischerella sp. PCC 9605]
MALVKEYYPIPFQRLSIITDPGQGIFNHKYREACDEIATTSISRISLTEKKKDLTHLEAHI